MSASSPAPWTLIGRGHIFLFRSSPALDQQDGGISEAHPRQLDHFNTVMLVDYTASDVGPYRELLFIPGRFGFPEGAYRSITRIYVSTTTSRSAGEQNWGIPKRHAHFDWQRDGREEQVTVTTPEGARVATLGLRTARFPHIPVRTTLAPRRLSTLLHPWQGRRLSVSLSAHGWVHWCRLTSASTDPALFPALSQRTLLGGVTASRFEMLFPAAVAHPAVQLQEIAGRS